MENRRLTEVTDKNGNKTRRWKSVESSGSASETIKSVGVPPISMTAPEDRETLSEVRDDEDLPKTRTVVGRDGDSVLMRDTRGEPHRITPGMLNDEARAVYGRGQCFAFAHEAARHMGTRVRTYRDDRGNLMHAYAESKSGRKLLDIDGWTRTSQADFEFDQSNQKFYTRGDVRTIDLDDEEAMSDVKDNGSLMDQHYAEAATMVEPVLDAHRGFFGRMFGR